MIALSALLLLSVSTAQSAQKTPKRIVSLAPSVTSSLYALGVEDNVIGITVYCPAGTKPKERIGTLWEPNIEKILSLAQDIVIASKEGNKKAAVEKLGQLGIPLFIAEPDRSYNGICRNFLALGKLTGREERAKKLIADSTGRIRRVEARVRDRRPVRVFWEIGANPLFTMSRNSFIEDYTRFTGSVNVFADLNARYSMVSREEVLRRDPDAIVLITMGDVTDGERAYWAGFKTLKAVRDNRIYVVTADNIFAPTPVTFADGVETIAAFLHPVPR